ncbi:MAG: hypothetical protein HC902_10675, partial [Calothrix sp. SM1_5_4]|nr:hypothetical protein [Calothrix sp. SM1_5_4]
FAYMVDKFGRIPNGNRDYYLSRSQPPFFALMVALWEHKFGANSAATFLPALKREHAFWMEGPRAVDLGEGVVLNRYWDDKPAPRPEAYKEDVELSAGSGRAPEDVYRNLRAAAESGWDFSTRWFADPTRFASIRTVDYIPVDLNCLLYFMEKNCGSGCRRGDRSVASLSRTNPPGGATGSSSIFGMTTPAFSAITCGANENSRLRSPPRPSFPYSRVSPPARRQERSPSFWKESCSSQAV